MKNFKIQIVSTEEYYYNEHANRWEMKEFNSEIDHLTFTYLSTTVDSFGGAIDFILEDYNLRLEDIKVENGYITISTQQDTNKVYKFVFALK